MKQTIKILQLYPSEMNIYGDWGNVLTLKKRLEWRGYEVELIEHHPANVFPSEIDLIVGGGGQDSGQMLIKEDLQKIADRLRELADNGVPMLMICGMYQLFGKSFETEKGEKIVGIGVFDASTKAGPKRLIGNVASKSDVFGDIIGFENHSGLTWLDESQSALGVVLLGDGNNGLDKTEGAIYKNVIGTYLHGSLLPKNPKIADWLIEKAILNRFGKIELDPLDDSLAVEVRKNSAKLKR